MPKDLFTVDAYHGNFVAIPEVDFFVFKNVDRLKLETDFAARQLDLLQRLVAKRAVGLRVKRDFHFLRSLARLPANRSDSREDITRPESNPL